MNKSCYTYSSIRSVSESTLDSMTSTKVKTEAKKTRVLYWFRTDLRIHDSPALQAALALDQEIGIEAFYPVGLFPCIRIALPS